MSRRRRWGPVAVAVAVAVPVAGVLTGALAGVGQAAPRAAKPADPYCTADYSAGAPRPAATLRLGIDPGIAGSAGGVQLPSAPEDPAREQAAMRALDPPGRTLVARLNRLFWSDGEDGIARFRAVVRRMAAAGIDSELQVRYHPPSGHDGDLAGWRAYVRHVVDVLGAEPSVVSMTITNEVNVTFSPNTSDGSYANAQDALIEGIVAAHDEATRRGYARLRFGFTFAYRFSPSGDAGLFAHLAPAGGPAFRAALGFVGLDFYPGSVYPPALAPGDTLSHETAQALGVMRDCYMPAGSISPSVPIWVTENGLPTGASRSEADQAAGLTELVGAVRNFAGTYGVTDYRWFNLRDSRTSPEGAAPGAAATFATDGLLRDDYSPKPAFAAYRTAIAAFGERRPASAKVQSRSRVRHRVRHRPRPSKRRRRPRPHTRTSSRER